MTINAHVDIRTLLDQRDIDDFEGLVLRGEGWALARAALDRYRCDSSLVATLFAGQKRVLDANTATEQFNRSQRRAIGARDRCCVFPGCTAPPRRCDVHHLEARSDGGPTSTANGCLLCRFHHRLLHEYRWRLEQESGGTWVATDPRGRRWSRRRPAHQRAA